MKDRKDQNTIDLFTGAKAVWRPRKFRTNAEKQSAYRKRLKLAQGG